MTHSERIIAACTIFLVFLYVVLRAVYVPTFHDEAATFFHYVVTGNFLPFQAHWDANNHLLNSALAWVCYSFFGSDQFWIRLPNVLSFLIFGFYALQISAQVSNRSVAWLSFLALLTAAFPLEFFSLARGYAMSLAFLMGAVYHGGLYLKKFRLRDQLITWAFMWLAVGASLTLVSTYLILLGVVFLALIARREKDLVHWSVWMFVGLSGLLAAAYYGFELKERGLLYTGLADGFVEVTVRSLVRYQMSMESGVLAAVFTWAGLLAVLAVIGRMAAHSLKWNAVRLSAALLLLNAVASVGLNVVFGMNFPENRVGMYYIPLFIITAAGAIDVLAYNHRNWRWIAGLFLFFPAHLILNMNLNSTILWPRWHASERIYNKALELQNGQPQPLTVSGEYLNELGWAFYNFQTGSPMQLMQRKPVPDTLADLIVARPTDFSFDSIPYQEVIHDRANGIHLLRRTSEWSWSAPLQLEPLRYEYAGADEFMELLNDTVGRLPATRGMLDLQAMLKADVPVFEAQLVMAGYDGSGELVWYDFLPMHWIRTEWDNDRLHVRRTFHLNEARTFKLYLWNMDRRPFSIRVQNLSVQVPE